MPVCLRFFCILIHVIEDLKPLASCRSCKCARALFLAQSEHIDYVIVIGRHIGEIAVQNKSHRLERLQRGSYLGCSQNNSNRCDGMPCLPASGYSLSQPFVTKLYFPY